MHLAIKIQKNAKLPVFRQIAGQITDYVNNGLAVPGTQLPSERELAAQTGVARGTITKAYDELARGHVIEILPGRRSVVSNRLHPTHGNRKEQAQHLIDELLNSLKRLRFSYREIRALVDLAIMERESRLEQLSIAAVDCNPESLSIFQRQLGFITQIVLKKILLDEILPRPDAEQRLMAFDLVITTSTHFHDLGARFPSLMEKLVQVVVAPTQQSVIDLAGIGVNQRIGVVCESAQFLNIIAQRLRDFAIPADRISHLLVGEIGRLPAFLKKNQVVITPPGYVLPIDRHNAAAVQAFTQSGGKIIPFDYQIERSSLMYVEERIRNLLMKR